jgi:hypothetical protein
MNYEFRADVNNPPFPKIRQILIQKNLISPPSVLPEEARLGVR